MKKLYFFFLPLYIFYVLWNIDIQIVPDWMNLRSVNVKDFFELILNITASIFGILIAVVLLSFEFSKDISLRRKGESIFDNRFVVLVFSLPVTLLVLSFISYVYIDNFNAGRSLTVAYYLAILQLTFVILIFPAIQAILASSNSLKATENRIENLSDTNFNEISDLNYSNEFQRQNLDIQLIRIKHDFILSVRANDYEAFESLLDKFLNSITRLIGESKERTKVGTVIGGFVFVVKGAILEAQQINNLQFLTNVWNAINDLYLYSAKKQIPLSYYEPLDMFIPEFIQSLGKHKYSEILTSAIDALGNSFRNQLKYNCPDQEGLSDLYYFFNEFGDAEMESIDGSVQWDHIIAFINQIGSIKELAIDNADKELYRQCDFQLDFIFRSISYNEFSHLKLLQRAWIAVTIFRTQIYYAEMANDDKLFRSSLWSLEIDSIHISKLIEEKHFYIKDLLVILSDFIVKAQRTSNLEESFLLSWGAIGRHIAKFISKNELAVHSMDYIIRTFERMKTEIESGQLPGQNQNYLKIKEELLSLKKYLKRDNPNDSPTQINQINKILTSFKDVLKTVNTGIVKWDSKDK